MAKALYFSQTPTAKQPRQNFDKQYEPMVYLNTVVDDFDCVCHITGYLSLHITQANGRTTSIHTRTLQFIYDDDSPFKPHSNNRQFQMLTRNYITIPHNLNYHKETGHIVLQRDTRGFWYLDGNNTETWLPRLEWAESYVKHELTLLPPTLGSFKSTGRGWDAKRRPANYQTTSETYLIEQAREFGDTRQPIGTTQRPTWKDKFARKDKNMKEHHELSRLREIEQLMQSGLERLDGPRWRVEGFQELDERWDMPFLQ